MCGEKIMYVCQTSVFPGNSYIRLYELTTFTCIQFKIKWCEHFKIKWISPDGNFNLIESIKLMADGCMIIDATGTSYRNIFRMKYGFCLPNKIDSFDMYFEHTKAPRPHMFVSVFIEIRIKNNLDGLIDKELSSYVPNIVENIQATVCQYD